MNWKILYKYVHGDCTEAELRKLGVWLQDDPVNEVLFTSFIDEWEEAENIDFESSTKKEWLKFKKNNLEFDKENSQAGTLSDVFSQVTKNRSPLIAQNNNHGTAYWAYSIVAILVLGITFIFIKDQHNLTKIKNNNKSITYQEISTVRGQRTILKLSDETKVIINANSYLRIPDNYGKGNRTIFLKGEAYFDVKHDEKNPFVVISRNFYMKDLGTKFDVMAYDSSSINVAVVDGLVSLGKIKKGIPDKEIVELKPNKLGIMEGVGGLTVSNIEHMDQHIGWTQGKLAFKDTPFLEVIKRLERWYDVDCKVNKITADLKKRTLTATYDNLPMSEVLKVLSISMNVSYTRQGHKITFYDGNNLIKSLNKK